MKCEYQVYADFLGWRIFLDFVAFLIVDLSIMIVFQSSDSTAIIH